MKYGMVILGGAAGEPLAELDEQTPLEAASTPNLDRLARRGRVGAVAATPAEMEPSAVVSRLALLGYDPSHGCCAAGAADAAGLEIEVKEREWGVRLDLVCAGEEGTEEEGLLLGMARGLDAESEGRLIADALAHVREGEPALLELVRVERVPGGAVLLDGSGRDYADVETVCPETMFEQPWEEWMPASGRRGAAAAEALVRLMELAAEALGAHPINAERRAAGLPAVNMAWAWGAGSGGERGGALQQFSARHGVRAVMAAEDVTSRGLGRLVGMEAEEGGWLGRGAGGDAARVLYNRLGSTDLVCVSREVGSLREGSVAERIRAIEAADAEIVGPMAEALERFGDPEEDEDAVGWRMLVVADRFLTSMGADATPTPLVMAGAWVRSVVTRRFCERDAITSDLAIEPGHDLMEYFLRSGLAGARVKRKAE